jgi:peptidoglycan/LPS O-acetylase OafA/YrhL
MKLRSIQALRALAALLVVGDHLPRLEGKLFPSGFMHGFGAAGAIGVDLFFVISGFIMVTTTWNTFAKRGASLRFISRRFLRIYPPYWAALIAFVAIGIALPSALYLAPVTVSSFLTSFFLIPRVDGPLLFVAWSLEFEVYFYLVFAIALQFPRQRLALCCAVWAGATLALNVAAHWVTAVPVQFLGSPLALEFMGGGAVGYLVLHRHIFAPRTLLVAGIVLAAAVAVYSSRFDGFGSLDLTWYRVLAAGPAMLLIVYGAVSLEEHGRLVPPPGAVALGDASYALYLWHGMLLGAYAVVVVGALAVYRFIELPLIGATKRLLRMSPKPSRAVLPTP